MQPIASQPQLADRVYSALRDAICDGQLAPGAPLVQERLAAELNVSRQPVVQALALLKTQGFVEAGGRRGLRVARLDPESARRVYAVRGALDRLAAREAARRVAALPAAQGRGPAEAQLTTAQARGARAVAAGEVAALVEADIAFHETVYALADNPLIAEAAAVHWFHIRRVMGAVLRDHGQRAAVWREHAALAEAILAGEVERAGTLAEAHVAEAAAALVARLEESLALAG